MRITAREEEVRLLEGVKSDTQKYIESPRPLRNTVSPK